MFNYNQATKLYLDHLRSNNMSVNTLKSYGDLLSRYGAFCVLEGLSPDSPAAATAFKAQLSDKGNKLVTMAQRMNVLHLFFDFCLSRKLMDGENPVLPDLMPPRKKVRAERKPYDHLMGEAEIRSLFTTQEYKGAKRRLLPRNRAMVLMLVGCGLRNTELRTLALSDCVFGGDEDGRVIVRNGKGGKFRLVPFPAPVQQAVKAYLASGLRPSGLSDDDLLFGVGSTREEWHMMGRDALSDMCERYVHSVAGFEKSKSHACRHAFASFNLTHGVPMAEIQSMLGHSSIMTTEHYAALLRPTAPTASGNKIFNDIFQDSLV